MHGRNGKVLRTNKLAMPTAQGHAPLGALVMLAAMMASDMCLASTSQPTSAPCPARGAHYRLLADPAFRITLAPSPRPTAASDLQLRLRTPRAHYVFAFTTSNGVGVTRLLPLVADADANADADLDEETPAPTFHAFSTAMHTWNDPPRSDTVAPAWLFVPELGPLLWYAALRHPDGKPAQAEAMPTGMFKRSACGR